MFLNADMAVLAATALLAARGVYVVPETDIFRARPGSGEVDLLGWRGETLFARPR